MKVEESAFNRTLIVGPSLCGKTHLLLNKLQLIRLDNPEQQIKTITRSPEQYENTALPAFGIEIEDTEGITIHMPQKWNFLSRVKCIFRKTTANRILVKQWSVFIVNFDAQCNQKLRFVAIERN